MSASALSSRRDFLRQTQNADGGWGYFPGKWSWLEPTLYAILALHGDPAANRGFQLVQRWALPQGGWRTSAEVAESNWTSALCLTVYCARNVKDQAFELGLRSVLGTVGMEGSFLFQLGHLLHRDLVDFDSSLQGWPWRPQNASWVEPTAHSVVALKRVEASGLKERLPGIRARIDAAERMLLDRRCMDGGWNYGNTRVRGVTLPSYPETTALALLGLQGHPKAQLKPSLDLAQHYWRQAKSPLARAWLAISLRNFGFSRLESAPQDSSKPSQDILIAALQCLGEPAGGHAFLKTGSVA